MKKSNFPGLWSTVKIVWADSQHNTGWHDPKSNKTSLDLLSCASVGYLCKVKKDYIVLVQSKTLREVDSVPDYVDNRIIIPMCAIRKVIVI